ncbi:hypothetical protein [Puia sp.]|jgi:chromosome segregation ATPase|uniref:hypothetical protein n=1 Tax=Puia sp. TaxID=2045100 RepID=UPI002F3F2A82
MNEELISQYVDRAAIQSDTDFVIAQLKALKESFDAISALKLKINSAQSVGDVADALGKVKDAQQKVADSSTKMADAATKAQAANAKASVSYDNLSTSAKKATAAQGDAANSALDAVTAFDKIARKLAENQIAGDGLRQQQRDLKEGYAEGTITLAQYQEKLTEVKIGLQEIKISNQSLTTSFNALEKGSQSAAGSLNELRSQLSIAQQAYDKLSGTEKNSEGGQQIKSQVDALSAAVNSLEQGTGRFGRNVGNYTNSFSKALTVLQDQLAGLKGELSNLDPGSKGFAQTEQQVALLEQILQSVSGEFSSSRQQLRAFQEAAVNLGLAVGQTDEKFLLFNEAIGEVKNSINDIKAATAFQAQDAKVIVGLTSAVNGLVGAYGAAQAAIALTGEESEDAQKQMAKFQQLLVLINGLQQVSNALQEESGAVQLVLAARTALLSAAKKINIILTSEAVATINAEAEANLALIESYNVVITTEAEAAAAIEAVVAANTEATVSALGLAEAAAAEAAAMGTATAATTSFGAALVATGIGVVIVAVGAAVAYLVVKIQEWTASTALSVEQQKDLNDALAAQSDALQKISDLQDKSGKKYLDDLQHQLELEQASGQNQFAILAIKQKIADKNAEIADNKYALALSKAEDQYVKQGLIGIDALHRAQGDYFEDLTNKTYKVSVVQQELNNALSLTDKQRKQQGVSNKDIDHIKDRLALAKSEQTNAQANYDFYEKAEEDRTKGHNEQENIRTDVSKLNADEIREYTLLSEKLRATAIIDANQLILNNEASTKDQRIAAEEAILAAQKATAQAELNAKLSDPSLTDGPNGQKAQARKQAAADQIKLEQDTAEKIRAITEQYAKKDRNASAQIYQLELQDRINGDQVVIDDEKVSYEKRLAALSAAESDRRAVIISQYYNELADVSLTEEQRAAILAKANSALKAAEIKYQSDVRNIVKQNQAKILADLQSFAAIRQAQINTDEANALNELNERYNSGLVSVAAYEKARTDLQRNYAKQRLQAAILDDYRLIAQTEVGTAARAKAEEQLSKDILALSQSTTDKQIADQKKLADAYKEAFNAVQDAVFAALDGSIDSQKNAIQKQIDLITQQKDAAIDAENATADAAAVKADKIANINAKAQADTERLQLRQKQLDVQKAKYDRAKSIAQVIEKTGVAVMEFLSEGDVPLSILAGITGAAELATILATPIPQYRYGTGEGGHPGGPAIVGDGGRQEPIILPSGNVLLSPAVATLIPDLPKGSAVLPSVESIANDLLRMSLRAMPTYTGQVRDDGMAEAMGRLETRLKSLEQAINNKPVAMIHNTYAGVQTSFESAQRRQQWLNRNLQS